MRKKDKITTNIAGLLKKYRKRAKLKQQEVADKLHISRQTVSDYERQKVDVPIGTILSFASLYLIPLDELLHALCNNPSETKYVNDNFPNINDPVCNVLLKYFLGKNISYTDAEFLYEKDTDGMVIREAINIRKTVNKLLDKEGKKT